MKKREDTLEQIVAIVLAAIIGITTFVLTFAWISNRPPETPGTGIPGESLELRDKTIRFVRENEALLQQAVQELETLPEGTYEVLYDRSSKVYIANNGIYHPLENQFLADLLEDTMISYLDWTNDDWIFHMEYGEESLFKVKNYSFIYSDHDPSNNLAPSRTWNELGSGKHIHWDTANGDTARYLIGSKGDLYIEEIGNGFWYFYEYAG